MDPTVECPVEAVQRAHPRLGLVERREIRRPFLGEERSAREDCSSVQERRGDRLTFPVLSTPVERQQHAEDRQEGVSRVAHPHADVKRWVPRVHGSRFVLEPARCLVEGIETARVRKRSFRAVHVGVAVDEVGLVLLERVVIHPQTRGRPLGHVVVDDVRPLDERV